jgi:hypothetical protein
MTRQQRKGEKSPDENDEKRDRAHGVDVEAEHVVQDAPAVGAETADNDADREAEKCGKHADEQRHCQRPGEEQPGVGDRLEVDGQ